MKNIVLSLRFFRRHWAANVIIALEIVFLLFGRLHLLIGLRFCIIVIIFMRILNFKILFIIWGE